LSRLYLTPRYDVLGSLPRSRPFSHLVSFYPSSLPVPLSLYIFASVTPGLIIPLLPSARSVVQDVVVFKSPTPTKFRLANALFPGIPDLASATESVKGNAIVQAELTAVEPASLTPSPAPSEEVVTIAPLVLLKGAQFGIAGTTSKFASRKHAAHPGLVEASWDSAAA